LCRAWATAEGCSAEFALLASFRCETSDALPFASLPAVFVSALAGFQVAGGWHGWESHNQRCAWQNY